MPKVLEFAGSPDCNIDRTFTSTFYFSYKATKTKKFARIYRNPVYLTIGHKKMIDAGEVRNQAELVRIEGISRTRITQILNLLKFDKHT